MNLGEFCQRCRQNLIYNNQQNNNNNNLTKSSYEIISNSISSSFHHLNNQQTNNNNQFRQSGFPQSTSTRNSTSNSTNNNNNKNKFNSIKITSPFNQSPSTTIVGGSGGVEESFFLLTESTIRPARNATELQSQSQQQQQQVSSSSDSTPPLSTTSITSATAATAPSITPRLNQLSNLYNILSSNGSIDYPLCTECMESLIVLMEKELEDGKRQRDRLVLFEKEVGKKREEGTVPRGVYEKEIGRLKKAEKQSLDELSTLEHHRSLLDAEKAALDAEELELAEEELEFWKHHSRNLLISAHLRDQSNSLQTRYAHDVRELEKLQKTNVYNDAFCIGQETTFGTINGLRLGRLPNIPVEWPEINAAWGHTLLLLYTIARKFGLTFETYRLVPMGSFSRIEKLSGDKAIYELYGSGDFAVTRLLQNRRFDMAMVAFLDCLRQTMEFVKSRDSSLKLPHAVQKDRIGEVSIKLQFGSDEAWTRALRHVLLDLKILLGRASV